jgi:GMP synthase (glutamine-hydrolysing)
VEANKVKEIGAMPVTLTEDGAADPLFGGFDREFPVFQWHGDTFRIPFGATWLAQSSDCKNQAFRKGNLVGVQFHLEADLLRRLAGVTHMQKSLPKKADEE